MEKVLTLSLYRDIINTWKGGNQMGKQKKKPKSPLDNIKTIVEIVAAIANIVLVIYTILKG